MDSFCRLSTGVTKWAIKSWPEYAGYSSSPVNPRKCEWGIQETDFLGHWLTPAGIKPHPKKIKAVLAMQPPKNPKQLRAFLGLATCHRDMWPRRSHTLAPLTDLLKTPKTFKWEEKHTKAFNQMKALIQVDALLICPDHNLPFQQSRNDI